MIKVDICFPLPMITSRLLYSRVRTTATNMTEILHLFPLWTRSEAFLRSRLVVGDKIISMHHFLSLLFIVIKGIAE